MSSLGAVDTIRDLDTGGLCTCAGICRTPSLTIAKQHISSAALEGPYWWNMNFPPVPSITKVLLRSP